MWLTLSNRDTGGESRGGLHLVGYNATPKGMHAERGRKRALLPRRGCPCSCFEACHLPTACPANCAHSISHLRTRLRTQP